MRTKHLFWALAMPAIFAACSNEDIEIPSQEMSNAMNRPMAGKVDLAVGLGDVDSRLDSNFQFEAGKDELGACLMDEYTKDNGNNTVNGDDFTFVDYIQTNYRYTLGKNGVWTNSSLLATGNYFIYYPYTEQLNARKSFEKYLNARQVLAANTTAGRRNLVNDNQMYAGHVFVQNQTEGDVTLLDGLTLQPVFAFPYFTLVNRDTEGVTIKKIALQYADDEKVWPLKAIIDPKAAVDEQTSYPVKKDVYGRIDMAARPVAAVKYSQYWAADQLDPEAETSAKQIEVVFPMNTVARAGQDVKTYMVIPSGDYTEGNSVKLLIYTTNGLITANLDKIHDNTDADAAGKEYNVTNSEAMEKVYGDVNLMEAGKYRSITVTFDEMSVVCPEKLTVSSTEDLDMYIQWATNKQSSITINAYSTRKEVELSKASLAKLAGNRLVKLNVYGDVTIAADAQANAYELVNFTGKAQDGTTVGQVVYNKATLTIDADKKFTQPANGKVNLVNEGTIDFKEGAALNSVENKGTIIFSGSEKYMKSTTVAERFVNKYGAIVNVTAKKVKVESIANYGTLNVAEGAELTGKVENTSVKNAVTTALEKAIVNINGTWTAEAGSINKGDMNVAGVANAAGLENKSYGFWYNKDNAYYSASICNEGEIYKLKNTGTVKMTSSSAIQQSAEGSTGVVDNTICSQMVTKLSTENIVAYVSGEKKASYVADIVSRSNADKLYISGTLVADYDNSLIAKEILANENERNLKEWSYIVGEQENLDIIVNENLTVKGQVCFYENRGTSKPAEILVNSKKTLTVASYAHLWIGTELIDVQGKMHVNSSAKVTANIRNMTNVVCAGTIVGNDYNDILNNELNQGGEVTLTGNTTVTDALKVENQNAGVDLGGYTLTKAEGAAIVADAANGVVASNGTINAEVGVEAEGGNPQVEGITFNGLYGVVKTTGGNVVLMNSDFNLEEGGLLVKGDPEKSLYVVLLNVKVNGKLISTEEEAMKYLKADEVGEVEIMQSI